MQPRAMLSKVREREEKVVGEEGEGLDIWTLGRVEGSQALRSKGRRTEPEKRPKIGIPWLLSVPLAS